ncbi:MAG: hypothetical protein L0Z48_05690 [candidate division Zixibacteria bacterium]|nr:hypothetical protein [candidate division Zixibacteria bacterium]MCI0596017.1 hypothetical protein [candidate division Zixibacteria bacterium]
MSPTSGVLLYEYEESGAELPHNFLVNHPAHALACAAARGLKFAPVQEESAPEKLNHTMEGFIHPAHALERESAAPVKVESTKDIIESLGAK